MEREGMVFYRSFYEAIKELPPEDFKKCASAILEYGLNGTEPESGGIEKTVYIMAKPQIDKNNQRYVNGKLGGRSKNQNETGDEPTDEDTKPKGNQTAPKAEPKEKDKEKVKEKDKEKVKEKDNVNDKVNDIALSSELGASEHQETVITLPLNDKSEYPVFDGAVQKWAELYPAVDVIQQLRGMRGWLEVNPARRKTKRGIEKFINGWLARAQDGASATPKAVKKKEFNYEQRDWDFDELERIKRAELLRNMEEERLDTVSPAI